jgi:hypothetical protein
VLTGALDHVSVRLKLRNDGGGNVIPAACCSANGSASSPAWRSCGPRARDTSRDGLSTDIMRPGQAVDTSPGGPLVRRQQRARSGSSRRIAVGDPRTAVAVAAAISPQQLSELPASPSAPADRRSSALATSTSTAQGSDDIRMLPVVSRGKRGSRGQNGAAVSPDELRHEAIRLLQLGGEPQRKRRRIWGAPRSHSQRRSCVVGSGGGAQDRRSA